MIGILKTHIGHENNEQAWTLLALVSQYLTLKDASFALDYFETNCNVDSEVFQLSKWDIFLIKFYFRLVPIHCNKYSKY